VAFCVIGYFVQERKNFILDSVLSVFLGLLGPVLQVTAEVFVLKL